MTANVQPIFPANYGIIAYADLSTQTATRDGSGTIVTLFNPELNNASNGALCENIVVVPYGINIATNVYLFFQDTTATQLRWRYKTEIALPAVTSIPANGPIVPTNTYPAYFVLDPLLAPLPTDATPKRGLRLNGSGIIWGVSLGTAIAGGIGVYMIGGRY